MNSETICACWDAADTLSQFASRMSLLSAISATSVLRSSLERSVLTFDSGNRASSRPGHRQAPTQSVEDLLNAMQRANDKALFDWKDHVQSAILIQDEAAVWAQQISERLGAISRAAALNLPSQGCRPQLRRA